MWDGIRQDAKTIAKFIKPGQMVAYYIDGLYAWTSAEIGLFPNNQHVTITVLGNPADAGDAETGDMTPDGAARWVRDQKAAGYWRPTIYRSLSVMDDVRKTTGTLVMGKDWDSWVADYDNNTASVYPGSAVKQFRNTSDFDENEVYDDGWPHRSMSIVAPITSPKWPAGALLMFGNRGNAVEAMQKALSGSGIRGVRGIGVDGNFGGQTLIGLKNFQAAENLTIDGKAGNQTRNALINLGFLNTAGQATD
jgi:peptidoglycan hydrolase-like protein with peptidoglycan-binding domain